MAWCAGLLRRDVEGADWRARDAAGVRCAGAGQRSQFLLHGGVGGLRGGKIAGLDILQQRTKGLRDGVALTGQAPCARLAGLAVTFACGSAAMVMVGVQLCAARKRKILLQSCEGRLRGGKDSRTAELGPRR